MSNRRHGSRALTSADHGAMRRALVSAEPRFWLRAGAIGLPILKCAVCPACLSVFGSVFAGARLGFLEEEGWHGAVILLALIADFAILGASMRHHARRGPLVVCVAGAVLAVGGHFLGEVVEYAGFALLLAAGIWNLVLLRHHQREGGACCAHHHGATPFVRHADLRKPVDLT
jgi:uncharacterized membrane protein YeiH